MHPRVKSSLLWGLVGVLAVLVLAQGAQLVVADFPLTFVASAGVALVVGTVVAVATYLTEYRLATKGRT